MNAIYESWVLNVNVMLSNKIKALGVYLLTKMFVRVDPIPIGENIIRIFFVIRWLYLNYFQLWLQLL
jgi:hypothetical protein